MWKLLKAEISYRRDKFLLSVVFMIFYTIAVGLFGGAESFRNLPSNKLGEIPTYLMWGTFVSIMVIDFRFTSFQKAFNRDRLLIGLPIRIRDFVAANIIYFIFILLFVYALLSLGLFSLTQFWSLKFTLGLGLMGSLATWFLAMLWYLTELSFTYPGKQNRIRRIVHAIILISIVVLIGVFIVLNSSGKDAEIPFEEKISFMFAVIASFAFLAAAILLGVTNLLCKRRSFLGGTS